MQAKNEALSVIVIYIAELGKWDEARGVANQIEDIQARSRAFSSISTLLARRGLLRQARLLAETCTVGDRVEPYVTILIEYAHRRNPTLKLPPIQNLDGGEPIPA